MKTSSSSWTRPLAQRLKSLAKKHGSQNPSNKLRIAILGIGNELNGDDAAGVWVVRRLRSSFHEWENLHLVEGGIAPENFTGPLRRFEPDFVILVDCAEMHALPGTIAWLDWEEIGGMSASTHTLPPTVLAQYLMHELGCTVGLIGIQPKTLEFDGPVSEEVERAVEEVVKGLRNLII